MDYFIIVYFCAVSINVVGGVILLFYLSLLLVLDFGVFDMLFLFLFLFLFLLLLKLFLYLFQILFLIPIIALTLHVQVDNLQLKTIPIHSHPLLIAYNLFLFFLLFLFLSVHILLNLNILFFIITSTKFLIQNRLMINNSSVYLSLLPYMNSIVVFKI